MSKELIILLILFCLVLIALGFYTKATGGLFLARNPWQPSDYQPTEANRNERKAGLAFARYTYVIAAIALPILLILYPGIVTKIAGLVLAIGIAFRLSSRKKNS